MTSEDMQIADDACENAGSRVQVIQVSSKPSGNLHYNTHRGGVSLEGVVQTTSVASQSI